MKHVLLFLHNFFLLTAAANVSNLNSLSVSAAVDGKGDLLGLGSPDPRFDVDVVFEGPRIPLVSILVSIVEYLVEQGLQEFSHNIPASVWRVNSYPNVQIVILPDDPDEHVERRLIVWGISQTAGVMINSRSFRCAISTLKWEREVAGRIIIKDWPPSFNRRLPNFLRSAQYPAEDIDQLTANVEHTSLVSPNHTGNAIDLSAKRFDVEAILDMDGPSLDLFDVFRTVIAVLVDAAEHQAKDQVAGFVSPAYLPGVEIDVGVYGVHRTAPPLLQNRWLMKVMAYIPECMIARGAFREGIFMVTVGGVRVARVSVKKKSRSPRTLQKSANRSVS